MNKNTKKETNECIKFHYQHPEIWYAFKKIAFREIHKKRKKYSAEIIVNEIRWNRDEIINKKSDEKFLIPNKMKAFYSRFFMFKFPTYSNVFEKRNSIFDTINYSDIYESM